VDRAADLAPVLATIRSVPIASATFVQVLRAIELLPPAEALTAESLAFATLQAGPEFGRWVAAQAALRPPPPEPGPAVVSERDGATLALELNRPANRNAMSIEMRDALVEALQLALADDSIEKVT